MPLFIAIPAALPMAKATIVAVGTMALGAIALFFGKRQGASKSPKSPQPEKAKNPPAPANSASTLITRVRDEVAQARTRSGGLVRETVKATVESLKEHAEEFKKFIVSAPERIRTGTRNITKAAFARMMASPVLWSARVQALDVEGLLKAFLNSPPRTRAPSFAA